MAINQSIIKLAKNHFENFLKNQKLRKTAERFAILEEIYSRNDHFTADELCETLRNKNFYISLAAVYNNLNLLIECGLVKSHRFGSNQTLFEKALGRLQHQHLICLECHKIIEFCDPGLGPVKERIENYLNFKIQIQELIFYGNCLNNECTIQKSKND